MKLVTISMIAFIIIFLYCLPTLVQFHHCFAYQNQLFCDLYLAASCELEYELKNIRHFLMCMLFKRPLHSNFIDLFWSKFL